MHEFCKKMSILQIDPRISFRNWHLSKLLIVIIINITIILIGIRIVAIASAMVRMDSPQVNVHSGNHPSICVFGIMHTGIRLMGGIKSIF
jgi:hypothetical protein